ncbi:MAG: winged helix-turn-helix domain-containing protein [Erysipelotrichaceae bacterium]|nr:winged helix-turn-helix domain-containing protein [Erysipelotrichaceae bacterium]
MKKKIGLINLDSSDIKEIHEQLQQSIHTQDFINGLEELLDGSMHSLMLEMNDQNTSYNDIIQYRDLIINYRYRKVLRNNIEINLTPKEFDILYFLAQNQGEVFTKEQIYKAVWKNDYLLDDSNIMAFIRKLRKKIEPHPDAPEYIITIWGIGYKFNDQ